MEFQIVNIWVETLYGLKGGYQCFGQVYCLHFQGRTYPIDGRTMFLRNVYVHPKQIFTQTEYNCIYICGKCNQVFDRNKTIGHFRVHKKTRFNSCTHIVLSVKPSTTP